MCERERGQSLIWFAMFTAFIVVPLMALSMNYAHLARIASRLQTATDAACEDAAYSAVDYAAYRDSGEVTFRPGWYVVSVAQSTFWNVLSDHYRADFSPALSVSPNYAAAAVSCTSTAIVRLYPLGLPFGVTKTLVRQSTSAIRFSRR